MKRILLAWIGQTDLDAPSDPVKIGLGPIACALTENVADEAVLLNNYPTEKVGPYEMWLRAVSKVPFQIRQFDLSSPTNFREIYNAANTACDEVIGRGEKGNKLIFHLSPGTSRMVAIWIILSKTRFPADLIESTKEQGVAEVEVPFDISAEFIPDIVRTQSQELSLSLAALPPKTPDFNKIIHRSREMERVVEKARRVALWEDIHVLVEGESGTGKELVARAIHSASQRKHKDIVCINCGAIPSQLIESELFGHERGAFTDAIKAKIGVFEAADGGTLFLDEIGEMPLQAQVKLLRVIQEKEVTRIGSTTPIRVDVRIIAATNKSLVDEIAAGRFREDIFFRLAGALLKLPPLRERKGDIGLLINHFLGECNDEYADMPGYVLKKMSPGAKNVFLQYAWPGNVRELVNTIRRTAIWSRGGTVTEEEAREALLPIRSTENQGILNRPLEDGVNLPEIINEVARHYLTRALEEAVGNKTRAAKLVGLPNYQTFSNWLKKHNQDKPSR